MHLLAAGRAVQSQSHFHCACSRTQQFDSSGLILSGKLIIKSSSSYTRSAKQSF
jgi:hypothetical protein